MVDIVSSIFVLSAMPPEKHLDVIRNVSKVNIMFRKVIVFFSTKNHNLPFFSFLGNKTRFYDLFS